MQRPIIKNAVQDAIIDAVSGSFDILSLSPLLWLDASDSTTITLNGSNVSQWDDKSGNNNNATQATASLQPGTSLSINGRQSIDSTHWMELDSTATVKEIFYVARVSTSSSTCLAASAYELDNDKGLFFRAFDGGSVSFDGYGRIASGKWSVNGSVYSDSVSNDTPTGFLAGEPAVLAGKYDSSIDVKIVAGINGRTNSDVADYAEILMFSSELSLENKARVEDYLAVKWGITI